MYLVAQTRIGGRTRTLVPPMHDAASAERSPRHQSFPRRWALGPEPSASHAMDVALSESFNSCSSVSSRQFGGQGHSRLRSTRELKIRPGFSVWGM